MIRLPNFTARALVGEAIIAYNLLHFEQLDPVTIPWPDLKNVILAFLRHGWTDNDEQLSGDYDPELRDALAAQVAKAAIQKYPWLRADPRPFPETTVSPLAFDEAASHLTYLYGLVNQLTAAIRDLRRQPKTREIQTRIQELSEILTGVRSAITEHNSLFAPAKPNEVNEYLAVRSPEKLGQYIFNGRTLAMNYLDFAGFDCPNCDYEVMTAKRPTAFGQNRKLNAYSCGCLSYALAPPPPGNRYAFRVDLALWTKLIEGRYTEINQENQQSRTYEHAKSR